ncbi:hypothetical protein AB0L65_51755 [Nonomuraea sp. NPDC052116]|uniref:hypothetical protein n=1 Tax=Nonomuraea sp. NPDC052116 TaxID=3155665 RepID=UPI00341E5E79
MTEVAVEVVEGSDVVEFTGEDLRFRQEIVLLGEAVQGAGKLVQAVAHPVGIVVVLGCRWPTR